MNDIKVSICCITYNHEKYIKDALDSFIRQKTNFKYEIIIHDDASTDNTSKIITEYQKKYPDLIVPILEKENTYKIRPNIGTEVLFKKARGEYIAMCEGDDGFLDEYKLQKQVDYMDKHKDISFCSHDTKIINEDGSDTKKIITYPKNIVTINYYIEDYDNAMHTSSMLFRKKDVIKLPKFFSDASIGDLPLKLHLLCKGNAYHMNEVMSFYRYNSINSYSYRQMKDIDFFEKEHENILKIYQTFDKETNYKYHDLIEERSLKRKFEHYKDTNNVHELKKEEYRDLYNKLTKMQKLKIEIKRLPFVYKIWKKIKQK